MGFIKKDIEDRVSTTDDVFTIESLGEGKSKLTPDKSGVTVEGTKVNKELLQRYEDAIDLLLKKTGLYLEQFTWAEIKQISESGQAQDFFNIGDTKSIMINGKAHLARIIGFNQDVDAEGNACGITFELSTIISDADGYSLALQWNDTNNTSEANFDYINSSIRKALCGSGNGADPLWAQKGKTAWSDTYPKGTTVLSMLPADLQAVLKTVKKKVAIKQGSEYVEQEYTDKLFMLCVKEMGYESTDAKETSAVPYKYYEGHTAQTDAIRVKKQVNGTEVSTNSTTIPASAGQVYQNTVTNYAGYNYKADGTGGGIYWLRSPRASDARYAWYCGNDGNLYNYVACSFAGGVAPAFCI